jgi:YHS domain-containing protein
MTKRALAATLLTAFWLAAEPAKLTYSTDNGIAIDGYDAVAYFTDKKATKGNPNHAFEWNGAKWLFADAQHKAEFAKDPAKFAPQYGGYCAYGMSRGYKAIIDPQAFTIVDGKLYLNYNAQVQETWRKDTPGYIRKADAAWPKAKDTVKVHR